MTFSRFFFAVAPSVGLAFFLTKKKQVKAATNVIKQVTLRAVQRVVRCKAVRKREDVKIRSAIRGGEEREKCGLEMKNSRNSTRISA